MRSSSAGEAREAARVEGGVHPHRLEVAMEFFLLGPLEARDGERPLALGGGKRRALLALLLLHANEVVPRERLLEELWPDGRPQTAERAVVVYVSQLRAALEPEGRKRGAEQLLVTHGSGYMLRIAPDGLDSRRFERLVREGTAALAAGDAEAAASSLDDALALWRGAPLSDFAYTSFAQAEIARLEEVRLVALEHRAEAQLALGRADEVVTELDLLIAEHPLRERLWGHRMLALYRTGRQAEALAAYRHMRSLLVEELGIDPSRELQQLEGAMLRHDPALLPRPVEGGEEPQERRPRRRAAGRFVGREHELARLEAGLDDALAGRGRAFVVTGGPGSGKSRLADEVAHRAKDRGVRVLWSRAWESGGAPELWPWLQLLRSYAREERGTEPVPEVCGVESDEERFRLFDSIRSFFLRIAQEQPLLLVFDDLQAADTASVLLLQFFADEVAEAPIVVLALRREREPRADDERRAALAALSRHGVARLALGGLDESSVRQLVERTPGLGAPAALAVALQHETGGNPGSIEDALHAGEPGFWLSGLLPAAA
jgi:DNA-binding SARP family transcriptional activator